MPAFGASLKTICWFTHPAFSSLSSRTSGISTALSSVFWLSLHLMEIIQNKKTHMTCLIHFLQSRFIGKHIKTPLFKTFLDLSVIAGFSPARLS